MSCLPCCCRLRRHGQNSINREKTIRFGWLSRFPVDLECRRIVLVAAVLLVLVFILVMAILSVLVLILRIRIILVALGIVKIPAALGIVILGVLVVVLGTLGILAAPGIVGILGIVKIPAVLEILIILIVLVILLVVLSVLFLVLRHIWSPRFLSLLVWAALSEIYCVFSAQSFCLSVNQRLSSAAGFDIIRC